MVQEHNHLEHLALHGEHWEMGLALEGKGLLLLGKPAWFDIGMVRASLLTLNERGENN